jgi:hypothetical protein
MTKAIRSHGTQLQMGDGGVAGTPLTGCTSATGDPYTIITKSSHGLSAGDPVALTDFTGTGATALNGDRTVAIVLSSSTFAVKVATTGNGTGGVVTPTAEAFTTVAEVGDIAGPDRTRETEDVTTHDSPDDYDEFIATVKSSGEVSFPVHWVPTDPTHDNATGLHAAYEDGVTRNWRIVVPDYDTSPSYLALSGFVNGLSDAMPVKGSLSANVKIKVVGGAVLHLHSS